MSLSTFFRINPITEPFESSEKIYEFVSELMGDSLSGIAAAYMASGLSWLISLIFLPIILLTGIVWKNDHILTAVLMSIFIASVFAAILFCAPPVLPFLLNWFASLSTVTHYLASFWATQFSFVTGIDLATPIISFTSTLSSMLFRTVMIGIGLMFIPQGVSLLIDYVNDRMSNANKNEQPKKSDEEGAIDKPEYKVSPPPSPRLPASTTHVQRQLGQGLGLEVKKDEKKEEKEKKSTPPPRSSERVSTPHGQLQPPKKSEPVRQTHSEVKHSTPASAPKTETPVQSKKPPLKNVKKPKSKPREKTKLAKLRRRFG